MLLKSDLVSVRISSSRHHLASLTNIVFSILWISEFVNEELYGIWRRSEETETAEMAHLFPVLIVDATVRPGQTSAALAHRVRTL